MMASVGELRTQEQKSIEIFFNNAKEKKREQNNRREKN